MNVDYTQKTDTFYDRRDRKLTHFVTEETQGSADIGMQILQEENRVSEQSIKSYDAKAKDDDDDDADVNIFFLNNKKRLLVERRLLISLCLSSGSQA